VLFRSVVSKEKGGRGIRKDYLAGAGEALKRAGLYPGDNKSVAEN